MFSFVEKQVLAGKCLVGVGPINPAEIPRDLSTETTSQALLQIPCRELHSGKLHSIWGSNHSPNAPLLSKATLAFISPSPRVSIGQRGSGLPLAPWSLLFAGGLLSWKSTANVFPFVDKQEVAGKCLLGAGLSYPPRAS